MKRFEIINNKWIKATGSSVNSIKLDSVSRILSGFNDKDYNGYEILDPYKIFLSSDGNTMAMCFTYKKTEKEEFEKDLNFLENLLYNQ
jgi:hypothetical protein